MCVCIYIDIQIYNFFYSICGYLTLKMNTRGQLTYTKIYKIFILLVYKQKTEKKF